MKVVTKSVSLALCSLLMLTACGGTDSEGATPESTVVETTAATADPSAVKNRPLNNCVSVFSGERPTRPQTREEIIKQREAQIAAMPEECRPKRR